MVAKGLYSTASAGMASSKGVASAPRISDTATAWTMGGSWFEAMAHERWASPDALGVSDRREKDFVLGLSQQTWRAVGRAAKDEESRR